MYAYILCFYNINCTRFSISNVIVIRNDCNSLISPNKDAMRYEFDKFVIVLKLIVFIPIIKV